MPLNNKMSHEEKVKELINAYKEKGKIGSAKPKDIKAALAMANAIAYTMEKNNVLCNNCNYIFRYRLPFRKT